MNEVLAFGRWLLETTAPPIVVLGLLGFAFREKWKQILARSLQTEIERQRYEFARDLEAYKTSLIAQAEAVKLRNDVQKTISNKYSEKKFDCLLALEQELARTGGMIATLVSLAPEWRLPGHLEKALAAMDVYSNAWAQAEMFFSITERTMFADLFQMMATLLDHIGPGKLPLGPATPAGEALMVQRIKAETLVRDKLHDIAKI